MDNSIDAILGIVPIKNNQVPFVVSLINILKDSKLIEEGITIPFLIGACKIQDNDKTAPTLNYFRLTLQKVINSLGGYKLFIKTCSNINQYVISVINDTDTDITNNGSPYPYMTDNNGCKVLFFEEYFDISNPSIESLSIFFWGKYSEELQHEKYSYVDGKWLIFSDNELMHIPKIDNGGSDSNQQKSKLEPRTKSQIIANELKFLAKAIGLIIFGTLLFAAIYGSAKYPPMVSEENQKQFNTIVLESNGNKFGSAYVEYLDISSYDSQFHDDWKFRDINTSRKYAWESDVTRTTWSIFFIVLALITIARYIFHGICSIVRWVNNNATN